MHFIKLRLEQIRAAGISEKKIAAIPLTSNADAIYDFINPDNLSDFCGGLLNQCFKECQERQIKDSSKSSECTAYTLRRDFCGRAIDGCGLDPAVVDCLVGHKQVEKNSPLATIQQGNADDQAVIAQKLGRVATLLEFSSSQAVKTLRFSPPVQIRTLGNGRVKLEADHDCILHFTVATTEPCDPLTIITNGKLRSGHNTVTTEAEDSRSSRRAAPVIYTQAFYDKYSDIGCALAHDYISKIKGGTAV